jgi:MoaA/NifB/PqqE/SkfB family radical SAM enzyme
VRIKPTNKCNHRCFYCSYDPEFEYVLSERLKRNDEIPKEKMMEILSDFKEIGVKAITYSGGGEPLVYPYISEAMQKTLDSGIDLSMITNGQLLEGKKAEILYNAKWVRVSSDSPDKETFLAIRRVPEHFFNQLIRNLENFGKRKNDECEFGINFVVNHKNYEKVYESIKLFKELGANHVKVTPLYTPRGFEEYHASFKGKVIEQLQKAQSDFQNDSFDLYNTYENDFVLSSVNGRRYDKCPMMQVTPVIGADSFVYFCHDKAYSSDGILGSLKEKSFKELWFSKESAEKFREFNPKISCRHHCTADARNILINDLISCYGNHLNFP